MPSQDPVAIRTQVCRQADSRSFGVACPSCIFVEATDENPYRGGQCDVFALQDHRARSMAMRIFREGGPSSAFLVSNEVKFRRQIEHHGIKSFQTIISFSETGNQLIYNPFVCLSWASGRPLVWNDLVPETRSERDKLIKAIANVSLDLLDVQEKCPSARDEITTKMQRKMSRAKDGTYTGGNVESCIKQWSLMNQYWIPELDNSPRVLVHGDLSANNIILDENLNLKSVLDLGWAEMVPLQFAAVYPRFLTHEPQSQGRFDWITTNTRTMQKDRLAFRMCVQDRAICKGGIYRIYYDLLCREDEVNRYWWFKAISEADKHRAMESCDWKPEPSSSDSWVRRVISWCYDWFE